MQHPVDARIADDNRLDRAVHRALAPPPPPELPDRSLIGERLADHGKDTGRAARTKLADELHQLVKQVEAIRKNPTMNAAQIELAVAGDVQMRVDRLLAECEEHSHEIDVANRAVEQGIEDTFIPKRPEWNDTAREIREVMGNMSDDERISFIERYQSSRHADLIRFAIASVPPELSGVSFGVHADLFDRSLAIKDPSLLSRPGDLKKRRAALAVAVDGIKRTAAELVDMDQAAALKALVSGGNS